MSMNPYETRSMMQSKTYWERFAYYIIVESIMYKKYFFPLHVLYMVKPLITVYRNHSRFSRYLFMVYLNMLPNNISNSLIAFISYLLLFYDMRMYTVYKKESKYKERRY